MEVEEFPEGSHEMIARFRESVVEPSELVAVSESDDLARGVMAIVDPMSRSRMLVEPIVGCDDGCGYRSGYRLRT